jgi:hypothetical protein
MTKNSTYSKGVIKNSNGYRLGLPLLLITAFCFVFVFATASNDKSQSLASSKSSKSVTSASKQSDLKVALPSTQLQTMTPVASPTTTSSTTDTDDNAVGADPTGIASSPLSTIKTAMPQSNSSGTANSLQPATKDQTNTDTPVTTKSGKSVIINLVHSIL